MFLTVNMQRSTRHQNPNYITCKHFYIILYITNTASLFITSSYNCKFIEKSYFRITLLTISCTQQLENFHCARLHYLLG